jgi:acyl carrier protein
MNEIRKRLIGCFTAVFPKLADSNAPSATMTSVVGWDSLATINLITVVEEEFRIQTRPQDVEQFVSFEAIARYLEGRVQEEH